MALAGHDTANLVFNVTSTATGRSGTLTGVVAGELIVAVLAIDGNTNTQDPSAYTVTLGSDTLSHIVSNTTTLNEGFSAIFSGVATASGDQTLSVTTPNATRAMACHAFRITGFDTTTPHPNSGQTKPGSNSTSLTSPNGVTTAADGNAIIGGISIHGGDITGLAVGAADGSTTGQTGTDAFSDCEWGVAWDRTPTAASVTFAWTWTGSDRPGAAWVEVAEAAGGGITGTGAVTTAAATVAGAGTVEITGSGGVAAAAAAVAGSGSVGSDIAGTGAVTTAAVTVAGAGTVEITGSGGVTLGAATVAGAGTVTITGATSVTIAAPTVAGSGTVTAGAITGTGAVSIPTAAVSGAGVTLISGSGSVTIGAAMVSGSEAEPASAPAANTILGGAISHSLNSGGIISPIYGGSISRRQF